MTIFHEMVQHNTEMENKQNGSLVLLGLLTLSQMSLRSVKVEVD